MSDIETTQQSPRHFVGIRRELPVTELPAYFAEVLPAVWNWLRDKGITPTSPPMANWCAMDPATGIADVHAGCFVAEPVEADGEITPGVTAGGEVLKLVHRGSYDTMGQSWQKAYQHAAALGRQPAAGWEIYIDDPTEVAADALRTEIYLPLVAES